MTGAVDNKGRALLSIRIRNPDSGTESTLDAWIDTGFTGELVLPQQQISSFGLPVGPEVRGVLADGSSVVLETYVCFLDWFGKWKRIEVVANQGQFPLLGVGLLLRHQLQIDYAGGTLSLT